MRTLADIATRLRAAIRVRGVRQAQLREQAGLSQRTLTNVLSGTTDFKVSTLIAVADRLGLELVLVPKAAVVAVEAGPTTEPKVETIVARALKSRFTREG